jgi:hypothetical protein
MQLPVTTSLAIHSDEMVDQIGNTDITIPTSRVQRYMHRNIEHQQYLLLPQHAR